MSRRCAELERVIERERARSDMEDHILAGIVEHRLLREQSIASPIQLRRCFNTERTRVMQQDPVQAVMPFVLRMREIEEANKAQAEELAAMTLQNEDLRTRLRRLLQQNRDLKALLHQT